MKRFFQPVWYYYFCIAFVITFIFFFPLQRILLLKKSWYPAAHSWRHTWARVILFAWGVKISVQHREYLYQRQPVIICCNHSSYLDIIALCAIFKSPLSFMAKQELGAIPLFGIFFKTIDIEVNRDDSSSGAAAYRQALKRIDEGFHMVIFPEGGILPDPLVVKPFKDGAFQLAVRRNIPVLPISLPDNYKVLPDMKRVAKPGKIRIILHEPLKVRMPGVGSMNLLKQETRELIQNNILK